MMYTGIYFLGVYHSSWKTIGENKAGGKKKKKIKFPAV